MMLLEYLRFFGWVFRKMDKMIKNLGNVGGPMSQLSDPTPRCSDPTPRRSDPMPQRRPTPYLASLVYDAAKGYAAV